MADGAPPASPASGWQMPPVAPQPAGVEQALDLAYRYLSRRERTVAELRAHLASREIESAAVDQVIDLLHAQGYLDDRRFARLFVEDKRELERWGEERIRRGLIARGIEVDLAVEVLDHNQGDTAELERARDLLRRRLPHAEATRRDWQRALGLLLRRGYEPELAAQAVRDHLGRG